MTEPTLRQELEYYSVVVDPPPGGVQGYKNLLSRARAEIDRLAGLLSPVICYHCKKPIERAGDWYRCSDCKEHYHEYCLRAHARDWKPSHEPIRSKTGAPGAT